ncbi:class I SAM-dependent methyltransferase [Roseibium aggregatum]|uniref:Class I SAM-dependent methyltransferase n=1 Tax=Roseibium aggregatum TaxID=187304 RepID=A0A926SAP8_9HYPH|nr:class I SAM-dependent methyltransferase [Roseibium aggregatum]MBD1549654.1 class I SAM-dependent methyltransferase [Roseibium aggregatum]
MRFLENFISKKNKIADASTLDGYEAREPSLQNAIDLIPGWNHAFPPEFNVTAGPAPFYADDRIQWMINELGGVANYNILELGPLEASHTAMLQTQGAAQIDAIEAHKMAFLRCLIVKEARRLDRARFHLGDFTKWLESTPHRYNLIVASGVLYHMADPVSLLELMATHTDQIYLWTHYIDDMEMPLGDLRRTPFSGAVKTFRFGDREIRLHSRSYFKAWETKTFCGGPEDGHHWMEKNDILHVLQSLGFTSLKIAHEYPNHPNGPSFSVLAQRPNGTSSQP